MLPCSVCESRGNFHLVLFESDEQGGDQFASQQMTYHASRQIPGSSKVVDLKKICFLVEINWFVPEHRHLPGTIMSLKNVFCYCEFQCQTNRTFDIRSFSDNIRSKLI